MDTSPNVPDHPQEPQSYQGFQATSEAPKPRRSRTPLIAGAAVLAVVLLGGVLHRTLPGLVGEPEPEPVAVEEALAAYAGEYLLGEPAWHLDTSRLAQEVAEAWTEHVDDVGFSEQVAHDDFDAGIEFLALEERIEAPKNGADYRNDVVLTHNTWYAQLRDGSLASDGDPVQNPEDIKVLGNVEPWTIQYVVKADSDIHTLEDLAGARMVFPWADTEGLEQSALVLLAAGVDPLSVEVLTEEWLSRDAFVDGSADVLLQWDQVSNAELDHHERQGSEVRVLEIPEEVGETLGLIDPSYTNLTVEAGTLPNQDEDINLVATWETLYAHADLDDELVQELVRVVYEDLGEHTRYADVTPVESALAGVDPDDVHPGAARYLREQGVL
ncbi:TAXI family TRAP transporter solute-binding subunit [Nocardiopsis ganjiahuensis]|uniref:TAXI family TRAP transporter solute-binding subunit n=1 Tax=Nocardiopsis ganjiahuensis TaxID=239984 RepID=UPI00034B13CE|nr:TAXI family TRAP transporter solute-binding subunit [Nocardiopsis ganjiahuensis]